METTRTFRLFTFSGRKKDSDSSVRSGHVTAEDLFKSFDSEDPFTEISIDSEALFKKPPQNAPPKASKLLGEYEDTSTTNRKSEPRKSIEDPKSAPATPENSRSRKGSEEDNKGWKKDKIRNSEDSTLRKADEPRKERTKSRDKFPKADDREKETKAELRKSGGQTGVTFHEDERKERVSPGPKPSIVIQEPK